MNNSLKPYVGAIVQFKNNGRDPEPVAGMITSIHEDKVELHIFRNGLVEQKRNVTIAEDAANAEAGQCWLLKRA